MVSIKIVKFETPVKCDHCPNKFNNNCALIDHMDSDHQSGPEIVNEDKDNTAEKKANPEEEIQVKYELDSVQNLKKAKSNLSRSTELKRVPIDDENIKFEVHPGVYLEIKDKAKDSR